MRHETRNLVSRNLEIRDDTRRDGTKIRRDVTRNDPRLGEKFLMQRWVALLIWLTFFGSFHSDFSKDLWPSNNETLKASLQGGKFNGQPFLWPVVIPEMRWESGNKEGMVALPEGPRGREFSSRLETRRDETRNFFWRPRIHEKYRLDLLVSDLEDP